MEDLVFVNASFPCVFSSPVNVGCISAWLILFQFLFLLFTINKADPTSEDIEALKTLLQYRFPQKLAETTAFNINTKLESLEQQSDGSLLAYYKRAKYMMEQVGAKDRTETGTPLMPLEAPRSFVKGIRDMDIKSAAARDLTSATGSFSTLYVIVEEARCTQTEIEKLEAAEAKDAELQYYKNLAKKRLSSYTTTASLQPSIQPPTFCCS